VTAAVPKTDERREPPWEFDSPSIRSRGTDSAGDEAVLIKR